ncbi:MAG TPA: GNAT family N-acetyltransferase [Solirubrobacteraceae bacterium]
MDGRPIDLARARREAKALLKAARSGDADALARVRAAEPGATSEAAQLADAQLAIARELGARSWPALVQRVTRVRAFVQAATSGRRTDAAGLLAPGLAQEALDAALGLGDAEPVGTALSDDPDLATRAIGVRGWEPLLYVAYSAFLGGERTDGLLACAQVLLRAGADPNAAWEAGQGRMTALHGAAGVAYEPGMTALLLEAGADPDDGVSLRAAAGAEDPACLALLLDAGARLPRAMALAEAAQRGRLGAARLLLERGAERWSERENALVWAVGGEASADMLRLLVEHGADLEASFDGSGRTPYGLAVRAGRRDLAEVLVSLGARRRVEPLDELVGACLAADRAGAERLAARHPEAARVLRTSEADVLVEAAGRGTLAAVEILLDLGVPVDARGSSGETALEAARDGEVASLLAARGADAQKRGPGDDRRAADEPAYAELEWAAEHAYLRYLATSPLAEVRPCGDGLAVRTGIADNTENGVVCSRLGGDVDAAIAETLAWFAAAGAPARWLLADPLEPPDLRERLVAAGATPERTAVTIGAELDRMALDAPATPGLEMTAFRGAQLPAGLEITAVRDEAALAEWMAVAADAVLDASDEELARRAAVVASLGLAADAPLQLRLARRDRRAVGAASFFVHGEVVLGQHVGVLAAERRGGVGRALVQAVAREARTAGARVAVLGPTPDTVAFYRLLGGVLRPALRDRCFYLPLAED